MVCTRARLGFSLVALCTRAFASAHNLAGCYRPGAVVCCKARVSAGALQKMHTCRHEDKFFERLARNPDLESGLHKLEENPTNDPVVRQLATVVLDECERARRRRENRKVGFVVGWVIGVFIIMTMLVILLLFTPRRH